MPGAQSVRRYLALQTSLPPMEQVAALARMATTGRGGAGESLSPGERADISDHLGAISQWKPTAWLLDAHARLERGQALPFAPRPDAANGEQSGIDDAVAFLLDEPPAPAARQGRERERMLVLQALAAGEHPDALPLFERLSAAPGTGPRARGLILRYLARNGHYPRAYEWIETRLMAELARLGAREARQLVADVAAVQRGDSYQEGRERWRTDTHAAATWPELALALHLYQVRALGEDHVLDLSDAFRPTGAIDYRARPELALALGGGFDPGVSNWAVAELAKPPRPPAPDGEDPDEDPDPFAAACPRLRLGGGAEARS